MTIIQKGIRCIGAEVRLNAANGQVHLCHLPCGRIRILAINGNVADIAAVVLYKFCGLHEHAAGSAAGIIYAALIWFQHLNQGTYYAGRRKEFSAALAFLLSKHRKTILISTAQDIFLTAVLDHLNICEKIHDIAEPALIQFRTGKVLRQYILQTFVFFLDGTHGVINHSSDFRRMGFRCNFTPSRPSRYKEDTFRSILINILFKSIAFLDKLLVLVIKPIRYIFQENQSQNNILIFRCIHVAAKHAGCIPYLFFKADIGCILFRHHSSSAFLCLILYRQSLHRP